MEYSLCNITHKREEWLYAIEFDYISLPLVCNFDVFLAKTKTPSYPFK